jgi:hypothetical protein
MTTKTEIRTATESALHDFWADIAKQFPNIETGEFPIQETHRMFLFMEEMVKIWLETNAPKDCDVCQTNRNLLTESIKTNLRADWAGVDFWAEICANCWEIQKATR